jgi:hypothetical protein
LKEENQVISKSWMTLGILALLFANGTAWCDSQNCRHVRPNVVASQIAQVENGEVQDVTVIRYDVDGNVSMRQYQVTRTLSEDGQSVTRTERIIGMPGRFVHHVSNDTDGNYVQDMYDFLPCDE